MILLWCVHRYVWVRNFWSYCTHWMIVVIYDLCRLSCTLAVIFRQVFVIRYWSGCCPNVSESLKLLNCQCIFLDCYQILILMIVSSQDSSPYLSLSLFVSMWDILSWRKTTENCVILWSWRSCHRLRFWLLMIHFLFCNKLKYVGRRSVNVSVSANPKSRIRSYTRQCGMTIYL